LRVSHLCSDIVIFVVVFIPFLKDVLIFIVRKLKGLESPSNLLFRRYFYLLENLSVVSTLVLAVDLLPEDATQVIGVLIGMISKLLRDVDQVSAEVLDVLFFYLINLQKVSTRKFKDSSSEIREVCVKDSHEILLRHSQLKGQVSSALRSRTRDLDDGVRLTAVLCIIETARKKLEAVNESLILACCDRINNKKVSNDTYQGENQKLHA
ncbi:hypothetical protein OESDEN_25031, partial [Oesophagostomum dentatum]